MKLSEFIEKYGDRKVDEGELMETLHIKDKARLPDEGYILDAPEVDAVPVVRCKDCKHYNTAGCSVGFGWCESMDRGASDEFFCSCGAKMEDKQ